MILEQLFLTLTFLLSVIIFLFIALLPALLEFKRPKDAGPKVIPEIIPKWNMWHLKLQNIEPFIPDIVTEENKEIHGKIFGLEKLWNVEVFY